MQKLVAYFFSAYNLSYQTLRFRQCLYLFVAVKTIYWICYYNLFFGSYSLAYSVPRALGPLKDPAFFLYNTLNVNAAYVFIFGVMACLFLSYVLKKIPVVFEITLWFLVINIQNKIYPTLTGGDFLLNQFLFFNCFFSKQCPLNSGWQNACSVGLNNFAVLGIIIQIQLVYLIAGLAKLNSADWLHGYAISELASIDHFNLFSGAFIKNNFINTCINYIVLFYQLLFPILIWFNKIKKPLIVIGILTHLYIAFVTGLVSFGFIMILPYLFFWPFKKQIT